jgi:hypothetical protein
MTNEMVRRIEGRTKQSLGSEKIKGKSERRVQ